MKPKFLDMRENMWGYTEGSHAGVLSDGRWAMWFADEYTIDVIEGESESDSVITLVNDSEILYIHVLNENRVYEEGK